MKHLTYADKTILVGDQAADVLMTYAALVARHSGADTVTVHGFGADGQEVDATFLLEQGAPLMAETSSTSMSEPDNSDAIEYMQAKIMLLSSPPPVVPADETMPASYEDLELPRVVDP